MQSSNRVNIDSLLKVITGLMIVNVPFPRLREINRLDMPEKKVIISKKKKNDTTNKKRETRAPKKTNQC